MRRFEVLTAIGFALSPGVGLAQSNQATLPLSLVCVGTFSDGQISTPMTERYVLATDPRKTGGLELTVSTVDAPTSIGAYFCDSCSIATNAKGDYIEENIYVSDGFIKAYAYSKLSRTSSKSEVYIDRISGNVIDKTETTWANAAMSTSFTGSCHRQDPQF
jgi:hypothetical protein